MTCRYIFFSCISLLVAGGVNACKSSHENTNQSVNRNEGRHSLLSLKCRPHVGKDGLDSVEYEVVNESALPVLIRDDLFFRWEAENADVHLTGSQPYFPPSNPARYFCLRPAKSMEVGLVRQYGLKRQANFFPVADTKSQVFDGILHVRMHVVVLGFPAFELEKMDLNWDGEIRP